MTTDPVSTKPLCRLCTVNPQEAIHDCKTCKQRFCALHLKEHANLFQESRALLVSAYNKDFSCNSKEIKLLDAVIEKISADILFSLVSHLATPLLHVILYSTKIPIKVEATLIQISKAKNITGLSSHIKRNFI